MAAATTITHALARLPDACLLSLAKIALPTIAHCTPVLFRASARSFLALHPVPEALYCHRRLQLCPAQVLYDLPHLQVCTANFTQLRTSKYEPRQRTIGAGAPKIDGSNVGHNRCLQACRRAAYSQACMSGTKFCRFLQDWTVQLPQASANVILLAELAQKLPDWNRTLDALLVVGNYKEKGNVPRLASEMGLEAPPKRLWLKSPVSMLGCQPEQIAELRALLEPYDVVGVQSFHGLFAGSQMLAGPLGKGCGNDTCCDGFQKATMAVRKAPQVSLDAHGAFVPSATLQGNKYLHAAGYLLPYVL